MQAIIITKDTLFSESVTCAMLREMAVKLFSMSDEAVEKLMAEPLTKGTKHMKELTCAKLRTILATKLGNSADDEYGELWRKGELEVEFDHLPDLDISKAGANTKRGGATTTPRASKLTGEYHITKHTKQGGPTMGGDEGMWLIWQHIWNCTTFEDYFAKAPAKGVKSGGKGSTISAASEMAYAVRSGFVKPGPKPTEQAAA